MSILYPICKQNATLSGHMCPIFTRWILVSDFGIYYILYMFCPILAVDVVVIVIVVTNQGVMKHWGFLLDLVEV